jgi:hypothetical protein
MFRKHLLRLLVMLEAVISLKTFLFVERHYTELADVPGFTPYLVSCANTGLPTRILLRAMSTLHNFLKGVSEYHPKVTHGGPHEAYVE